MADAIEQYILDHIDPEGENLQRLNRDVHVNLLRPRMLSGHLQGRFLKMLCRMIRPKSVLEIGTYAGYSALCMAEALANDAEIHTIEIDDELEDFIQKQLNESSVGNKIHLHFGDAADLIPQMDRMFDMVFIDADKRSYSEYYDMVFDKVVSGGFIIADNTLWDGKVLETPDENDAQTIGILAFNKKIAADKRVEKVILPLRDGITLIHKLI
ncbi:MAG: class I SAM-dependent methyltransferase [Bacteroidales bacterium]|nr:class I SAM-dependent methyltransferase [Bacteroidales bacterium]